MRRFAGTIFLSALLLFMIQPLIARFILPWFGGGAGVWAVCMLFFQAALLLGYAYAHALATWLAPRRQAMVHLALLAGTLALLPVIPDAAWKPSPDDDPAVRILLLLAVCLGGPYVMLSSTGPLIQAWFARRFPGASPYRLYALSNAGSLLGLIAYPVAMEPWIGRHAQGVAWSAGYTGFVVLCAACAITVLRHQPNAEPSGIDPDLGATPPPAAGSSYVGRKAKPRGVAGSRVPASASGSTIADLSNEREPGARTTGLDRLLWVLLPGCASVVLLAVTNQLTQEVAPMPFMWVLPLVVYLLTFIITFEWPRLYNRMVFVPAWLLAMCGVLVARLTPEVGLGVQVTAHLAPLGVCAMICHGELYRKRPAPDRLTGYYLAIAAGGAIGGLFVSILAPLLFSTFLELYIGLFGTQALLLASLFSDPKAIFHRGAHRLGWLVLIAFTALIGFGLANTGPSNTAPTLLRKRNFYGALAVRVEHRGRKEEYRLLVHGRINHGAQFQHPMFRRWATMYYGPQTGVGVAMRRFPKGPGRRVGVVGLGTGALAAAITRDQTIKFYEINPQVIEIAQGPFTYLADCSGNVEIALGDARLVMEREPAQRFDILVLDAFSGDAIPTHLLTREAFLLYERHLNPDGVIAVHITNRYLDLHGVVQRQAEAMGFTPIFFDVPGNPNELMQTTFWALMTRNQAFMDDAEVKAGGVIPSSPAEASLWTDDFCSVLEVMRWSQRPD